MRIEPLSPALDATGARRLAQGISEPPVLAAAADHPALARTAPDPELIGLFIEEAREEVARIRQQFPLWDHNPLDFEPLLTLRRSFHTLKGSGRMVNARALSEFSWAIENLLNRILDGTQQRSPSVLETLRAAVEVLPQLVTDLESGHAGRTDVTRLAARAHALASGRDVPAISTVEPTAAVSYTHLDVYKRQINGYQATRALLNDPDTRTIPIVMVTSKGQQADRVWGLRQGAVDYLVKPVSPARLVEKAQATLAA